MSKILFIDGDDGRVIAEDDAETVPAALRFADTPEGRVAVAKVVATRAGDRRAIREYAADGRLLRSTLQVRG